MAFTTSHDLLGSNLRRIRTALKLSQAKLAEKCGLSTNFVNELEKGKAWVSAETLDKICLELKIDHYRLFIPETMPEIKTDDILADCCNEIEEATKKAIDEVRQNLIKRKR